MANGYVNGILILTLKELRHNEIMDKLSKQFSNF